MQRRITQAERDDVKSEVRVIREMHRRRRQRDEMSRSRERMKRGGEK
jgi:hypothetical protein